MTLRRVPWLLSVFVFAQITVFGQPSEKSAAPTGVARVWAPKASESSAQPAAAASFCGRPADEGGCGNMTYHSFFNTGAVQHTQKVFTIFWSPAGTSFPANYQSKINQFIQHLSGTALYAIASQYGDEAGHISTSMSYGGTWLDTTNALPSTVLTHNDILAEVKRAKTANGWPSDANAYYQVYTPSGYVGDDEFCGWHSFDLPNLAFGFIVFPKTYPSGGSCFQSSPYPNFKEADAAINTSSHEILETLTDPLFNGWYFQTGSGEIADLCNFYFGPSGSRDRNLGSNVTLNGHPYLVQYEWSNADGGCVLAYGSTAPSISSVSPNPVIGSATAQTITINGSNFVNKPWVTVTWSSGGKVLAATDVTYVSSTQLQMSLTTSTTADTWDVKVTNPNGNSSSPFTFIVKAPTTGGPTVTTGSASSITQTSAIVSGTVNPNGAATNVFFDYGTTASYGSTATYGAIGSGTTAVSPSFNLTGLQCNTTYHYRARAQNSNGTSSGLDQSFTTSACPQQGSTELITNGSFANGSAAWSIFGNLYADSRFSTCRSCPGYAYVSNSDGSAGNSLTGYMYQSVTIPANATAATLSFWYSITTQEVTAITAFDVLNVSLQNSNGSFLSTVAILSNLDKTTGYVQRTANLLAYAGQTIRINFLGTTDSTLPTTFRVDDVSLLVTVSSTPPSVSTGSASGISQTGSTVSATVNPNGSATTLYIDYGPTNSYGSVATYGSVGSGTSNVTNSVNLSGLNCSTQYQYRARAQNSGGTGTGSNQSFTTSTCASNPTIALNPTSMTFNGDASSLPNPPSQTLMISNSGSGSLGWSATTDASWLSVSPTNGTAPSSVSVNASVGTLAAGVYNGHVIVSAAGATNTPRSLDVTFIVTGCTPVITAQPSNKTISAGDSTTLNVSATGATPFTYAWYRLDPGGSTLLQSGSSNSLTVTPSATSQYFVWVSNSCGAVISNLATVTVKPVCLPLSITSQPLGTTIVAGQSTTLTVAAAGSGPRAYYWYRIGSNGGSVLLQSGPSASLTVSPSTTTDYFVWVYGGCETSALSNVARVSVPTCNDPAITAQPASVSISPGQSTTLTVGASGTAPLTYYWYRVGASGSVLLQTGPSASLTVSPSATTDYFVWVYGSCGTPVQSNVGRVTVSCASPSITSQPASVSILPGQSTTLTVGATGTAPLVYYWYRIDPAGSVLMQAGTSPSLTVAPSQTTDYFAWVYGCGAPAQTNAVRVIVSCISPSITAQPLGTTISPGQSTTLSVAASGTGPFAYYWYRIGSNGGSVLVQTGASSTLSVAPSQTTDYFVWVYGACNAALSNVARVNVTCTPVSVAASPTGLTSQPGQTVQLTAAGAGTSPFTYEWYQLTPSGTIHVGTNSPTLTVAPLTTSQYFAWIYNACGAAITNLATITINCVPVSYTSQPLNVTMNNGQTAMLSVGVAGTGPFTYQWYQLGPNGSIVVPNGTSASLFVSPAVTTQYFVWSYNPCGAAISNLVTVTVH